MLILHTLLLRPATLLLLASITVLLLLPFLLSFLASPANMVFQVPQVEVRVFVRQLITTPHLLQLRKSHMP
jgi:hypothetical protein